MIAGEERGRPPKNLDFHAEIADLLGVTRASAWHCYAGKTTTNRTPTVLD